MVAALLEASPRHLSATELEQQLRNAGWRSDLSGIHRAMVTFIDRGLVHTLPTAGPVAYGISTPAHHHAICTHCGATIEVPVAALTAAVSAAGLALEGMEFRLAPDGLAFHGRCGACHTVA